MQYQHRGGLVGAGKTKQVAETGALNEMRAEIEQKLTIERADKELEAWLQDQRKRTKIEYAEKDLAENEPAVNNAGETAK